MAYLMGVDLGSTSLKAIVYDLEGRIVASGSRPTERAHPDPGHPEWTVWMPEMIWGGVTASIRDAVAQLDDPTQIRAVAVAGMGGDGVPVDENGQWLYPFISWLCPRTAPQLAWWEKTIGADKTFAVGGNMMWTFSSALRVLWMQEHEPEILKRTAKWLLIEDFVNYMLSGVQATDYSMASTTFLFDQLQRTWSDEMLGASGIDRSLWCDPHPSGTIVGEVHDEAAQATGLPAGTPVVLGGHDFLCGALPVGAFEPGVVLDVTGTWEVVVAPTAKPVLSEDVRKAGVMVESHVAKDTWGPWGGAVASDMLEWYLNQYGGATPGFADAKGKDAQWSILMAEAAAAPVGAGGHLLYAPHGRRGFTHRRPRLPGRLHRPPVHGGARTPLPRDHRRAQLPVPRHRQHNGVLLHPGLRPLRRRGGCRAERFLDAEQGRRHRSTP